MILVDSDVAIDFLQAVEPSRSRLAELLSTGQAATTALNAFELLSGARSARQLARIEDLLGAMKILELTAAAAARAAVVRRQLEKSGGAIAMADALIAGVALCAGLALWTRNRRHFERVPGLALA